MAVMKYKENGEWVAMPAAVVNTVEAVGGNFKWNIIDRTTDNTVDLSSYVAPGADFMIMFTASAHATDSNSPIYVWFKSINTLYKQDGKTTHAGKNSYYSSLSSWFDAPWISTDIEDTEITVAYDEDACVLSLTGYQEAFGKKLLLFYA